MELKLLKKDDIYMISAKGSMDLYSSIALKDLTMKILGESTNRLIINLANVDAIDSGGIGALLNICSTVGKLKVKLAVTNMQESVKNNLNVMKVCEYIPLANSVSEAVALITSSHEEV